MPLVCVRVCVCVGGGGGGGGAEETVKNIPSRSRNIVVGPL